MTARLVSIGTPVRFREYPREKLGRYHDGHIIRVRMPGTIGVPEPIPTYCIFDQRTGRMRFLKRDEFKTNRKRGPR